MTELSPDDVMMTLSGERKMLLRKKKFPSLWDWERNTIYKSLIIYFEPSYGKTYDFNMKTCALLGIYVHDAPFQWSEKFLWTRNCRPYDRNNISETRNTISMIETNFS